MWLVVVATAALAGPPRWMFSSDALFADMYNKGDFEGVQALYFPDALLVPPTTDRYVLGNATAGFFAAASSSGLKNLTLTPLVALEQIPGQLWHEIGEAKASTGTFKYYVRWEANHGGGYSIAFDCMDVGVTAPTQGTPLGSLPVPQWLVEKEHNFARLYNAGDFNGIAAQYTPDAQVIPPPANSFIPREGVAQFFKGASQAGMHNLQLSPVHAFQQSSSLVHEIGHAEASTGPFTYYTRWEKTEGQDWLISFDIITIGA